MDRRLGKCMQYLVASNLVDCGMNGFFMISEFMQHLRSPFDSDGNSEFMTCLLTRETWASSDLKSI